MLFSQILEEMNFMSLNYYPEDDEGYTCRFIFDHPEQGQVVQDQIAYVDVISEYNQLAWKGGHVELTLVDV